MIGWLIIPFFISLFIGIPISFSLGVAVVIFIFATATLPYDVMIETMYNSTSSFPLMAIPFFVLAGELMNQSGITDRLINFAKFFLGRFRGGLTQVTVVSGIGFAGLSGSAVAETAALGRTIGTSMTKEGYDKNFTAALIASVGVMAPVIPPSVIIIVYGAQIGVSIGEMFVAGIVPGLLIGLAIMIYSYIVSVKKGFPRSEVKFSWKSLWEVTVAASLAFILPIIVVFGIRGGIFTPTEGGAIAAAYAFFIGGIVYRNFTLKGLFNGFVRAGVTSAVIMLVISMSEPFGWVLSYFGIPQAFAETMLALTDNPTLIVLMMLLLLIVAGMFLEGAAIVMLLGPVLAPLAVQIGMDPVHWAILVVVSVAIGMVTPPLGVNLFVMAPIMNTSIENISKSVLPFIIILLITLLILTFIPGITLWLPGLSD